MDQAQFSDKLRLCLQWTNSSLSAEIESRLTKRLLGSIEIFVEELRDYNKDGAETASNLLRSLPFNLLCAFVKLPHITGCILYPDVASVELRAAVFLSNLAAASGHLPLREAEGRPTLSHESTSALCPSVAVPLSFADSSVIPQMDRGGNELEAYGISETRCISKKTVEAFQILDSPDGQAGRFVRTNTEVLTFRAELSSPERFSSASFRTLPGLSLFVNASSADVSSHDLADAVLHEAIHALIYRYEALYSRLVPTSLAQTEHLVSPWTGAKLPVDSFVQACFVWFGLYQFWRNHENVDQRCNTLSARARCGFESRSYIEACRYLTPRISHGVAATLQTLADLVVSSQKLGAENVQTPYG